MLFWTWLHGSSGSQGLSAPQEAQSQPEEQKKQVIG
jgi:hypothetical protein